MDHDNNNPFYHILNNKLAYLDIVSTIAHELTHKRQYHEIDQLKKHGVKYEEMNDYYKSLYFFRSEKFMNKLNNIIFSFYHLYMPLNIDLIQDWSINSNQPYNL